MRAKVRSKVYVSGLIETSDEIARLQHCAQHGCGIPRIGAQVAVAQIVRRKQRGTAGKIKHEIAARSRAIAGRLKNEGVTRGGAGCRVIVDDEFEGAEIAPGAADGSLDDREGRGGGRHDLLRSRDHDRDVEMIGQQFAGLDRALVPAIDQDHAFA